MITFECDWIKKHCHCVLSFQHNSCYITLLRCCSKLAAIASITPAHTSPSVPIISSSSSSIIRHLEWSWKLVFHPGVMGNTRPSTPGSRFFLTPFGLSPSRPGGRVWPSLLLRAPLRSRFTSFLLGLRQGDAAPAPRGPWPAPAEPPFLDRPGLAAPVASLLPRSETTQGWFLLVMGCAAGV